MDCEVNIDNGTFTDCKVSVDNTTVIGVDGEKDRPAVWCKDSNVVLTSCTVTQPQYNASIYLKSNNYLELNRVDAYIRRK